MPLDVVGTVAGALDARLSRRSSLGLAVATALTPAGRRTADAEIAPRPVAAATPYATLVARWDHTDPQIAYTTALAPAYSGWMAIGPDGVVWTMPRRDVDVVRWSPDGTFLGQWNMRVDPSDHGVVGGLTVDTEGTVRISLGWERGIRHYSPTGDLLLTTWVWDPAYVPVPSEERLRRTLERYDYLAALAPGETIADWAFDDTETEPQTDELVVARDGTIYCLSHGGGISHLGTDGCLLAYWGGPRSARQARRTPSLGLVDIALGPDGSVWAVSAANHDVRRYTPTRELVANWGDYGSEPGQLKRPKSLAVRADGTVLVADTGNHRVQHFAPDGTLLGWWGGYGDRPGQFDTPYQVKVAPDGTVAVMDGELHRVQRFALA